MRTFHEFDENNPLDFLIIGAYIFYQTLGQTVAGQAGASSQQIRATNQKEKADVSTWTQPGVGYAHRKIDQGCTGALASSPSAVAHRSATG
jgi:hypothetical protein